MSVTAHGKVKRYWPGKAPEWADRVEEDADLRTTYRAAAVEKVLPSEEEEEEEEDVSAAEDAAKEEDLDAVEERRQRIREKAMDSRRREEEEMELPTVEEEDEYETDFEEEEEEYETEKPVFVRKQERETLVERERMEEAERAVEEAVKRRMAERKAETKQIVVEKIREEYEIIKSINDNEEADAGDDDEVNEAEEYERWKAGEIARIKCDREEDRDPMLKIKRVRKMTEHKEDERREWKRKKSKRAFMQKYYHKGSFFQDEPDDRAATVGSDEIYRRDFSAPTGEDKLNKTILPKVMQVKHFGRSGRTKWTHLVAEDTTHWTHTLRFT